MGLEDSVVKENFFIENYYKGVDLGADTRNNTFYYNSFITNNIDAYDESVFINHWYYSNVGNYWSGYSGVDEDGDGIGDTPYPIEPLEKGNFDYFPLMQEYTGIDIFPPDILNLQAIPQIQIPNGIVNITCTIIDNTEVNHTYINISLPDGSYINESLSRINLTDYYYFVSNFSVKGEYYYYVWADDIYNNSEKSNIEKFVIAYKPTANFTFSPSNPTDLDNITFDASSSYDEDGYIVNYTWQFYIWKTEGYTLTATLYGKVVIYRFSENSPSPDRPHKAVLTVYDNDGAWDTTEKEIFVSNIPPVANFTFSGNLTVGEPILFNDMSYDPDGSVEIIAWDFGDGTVVSGARRNYRNITHSYTRNGIFNVTLNVTDDDYASSVIMRQITILDIEPPRIENLTAYPNPQEIWQSVNISCKIYDDVEVAIARINITLPNGSYINDSMIANGNTYFYLINGNMKGNYTYYIWAVDTSNNSNSSMTKSFTIIVPPEPPHIENVSVNPNPQQYGYSINISCHVYDNVAVEEVRAVFSDGNISMIGITDEKGNGIYFLNTTFEMGEHEFYIYTTDINGYINKSGNYSFEIVDELPPSITDISFPSLAEPSMINISCNVYDNREVASVSINISNQTSWSNESMFRSGNLFYINKFLYTSIYHFTIWAKDVSNNSASSFSYNFTITYFPTANFSYDPSSPYDIDIINFTDLSSDEDGTIVNYTWNFGDGNVSYEKNPQHQYADDGIYNVTLTVIDNYGAIASVVKQILVLNMPPIANFTFSPSNPTDLDNITFDASSSYDEDGYIVNYTWDFNNDGVTDAYGMNVSFRYEENGTYAVKLSIRDNDDSWSNITKYIYVANIPPVADFIFSGDLVPGGIVHFNDSSYDLDGEIVSWYWNFGDGTTSYEQNPSHMYTSNGTYVVNLTVIDNDGEIAWREKEVTINLYSLIANFSYSPQNPVSMQTIYFTDLSHGASSWRWNFGDGTTSYEQNPSHIYYLGNYYNVTLTVFNGSVNVSISKIVEVDTRIQIFKNENNVVNYIPWLGNALNASELASMIGNDIMPTGSVVSRWNVSRGAFDSYVVGISPPSYDFVIRPYDAIVLRVANSGEFVVEVLKCSGGTVYLCKKESSVVNDIVWSCLHGVNASELASMIGNDIMPTGSVVSRWNVSRGAFDSYVVGISPPSYDFVIHPGDVIVLRVANSGEFVIEVIK